MSDRKTSSALLPTPAISRSCKLVKLQQSQHFKGCCVGRTEGVHVTRTPICFQRFGLGPLSVSRVQREGGRCQRPGPLVSVAPHRVVCVGGHVPAEPVTAERVKPQTAALAEGITVVPPVSVVPPLLARQGRSQLLRRLLESGVELFFVIGCDTAQTVRIYQIISGCFWRLKPRFVH